MTDLLSEFKQIPYIKEFYDIAKQDNRNLSVFEQGFIEGAYWMFEEQRTVIEQAICNHIWCGKSENQYCDKCGKQG